MSIATNPEQLVYPQGICKTCKKTTWAGCVQHVDQVKATVPSNQWCTCPRPAIQQGGGFFTRLFGN